MRPVKNSSLQARFALTLLGLALICDMKLMAASDPSEISRAELEALEAEHAALLGELEQIEGQEALTFRDLGALERALLAAAMESQRREEQASQAERKLISLQSRLQANRLKLVEGEQTLEDLLGALAISGRYRPPALLTQPKDANAAIRTAIIMGELAPRVQSRTIGLSRQIETLRKLESEILREQKTLADSEAALKLKQQEILGLTAAKRKAFEDVTGNADSLRQQASEIGRKAETLRSLLAALEAAAPAAPLMKPRLNLAELNREKRSAGSASIRQASLPTPSVSQPLGVLATPTAGRLVRRWGDRLPGGTKSEGITYATRSGAQIASPIDGKVEFSGPFRSYGQLLILSTSDGYHVLLSGMTYSYVGVGQYVRQGEPVARMSERSDLEPELYMEVRKSGKPMNPATWMRRG